MSRTSRLVAVLLAAGLVLVAGPVTGARASATHAGALAGLADLAAQRVLLADKVAAAKFGTTRPIDDPVRERQLLGTVATRSVALGLPPELGLRFFRDQIEAGKQVQRGLFAEWTAHPERRPDERPDLVTEVRPRLDRLTTAILRRLVDSAPMRARPVHCAVHMRVAKVRTDLRYGFDALHRRALTTALRSSCS